METTATVQQSARPVVADECETAAMLNMERYLSGSHVAATLVVGLERRELPLPEPLRLVLEEAIREMAQGHSIAVVPVYNEMTTKQAAELLNVSRRFLMTLLEREEIPCRLVGTRHRIRFDDVMAYRHRLDSARSAALADWAQERTRVR
jgi:excisionase family DNA binding protein